VRRPHAAVRSARRTSLALLAWLLTAGTACAIDYRSISVDAGILYDGPSTKAQKVFILGRGYPVEVLVTLEGWVKVRDATGALAWIESGQLSGKRMVMVKVPRAQAHAAADETAPVVFEAEQDVVLELLEMAGNFARVRHADGATGFVRVNQVWGL
jgi:SH3-like domain-containing protein